MKQSHFPGNSSLNRSTMAQVWQFAALLLVLQCGLGNAVTMRRSSVDSLHVEASKASINASHFSRAFLAAVDAKLLPGIGGTQHSVSKQSSLLVVSTGASLMKLAAEGASQLDAESIPLPRQTVDLLRSGHQMAAGGNMWKSSVDKKIVEKAIVNLNGMVFEAQKRLDAKNDECEEFKAKYTETLDQINGDLARLGEELSNTARAILVHNGGIDSNILNNQQTKEELLAEQLAYNEVRNADLIVLQERQTNMAVSAFILVFSACPNAPSAASMLQTGVNASVRLATHDVQTCANPTGAKEIRFGHPKIDTAAQQLSTEAQDMLMRFISTEQSKKGGRRIADAASKLEAMALSEVEVTTEELDDGDVEGGDDNEVEEEEEKEKEDEEASKQEDKEAGASLLQQGQDPCGPPVERAEIPDAKPCSKMPASCCSCNKYFTTVKGQKGATDEMAWCFYVPERRKCQSGKWLKRHEDVKAEVVCGLKKEEQHIEQPPKSELKAANRCSNAKFDCGVLHDMFAALWGETKDLVDELVWKMNQDTAAWDKVKEDVNTLLQTQATQLANLQAALAEATAMKAAQMDEQAAKQKEKTDVTNLFDRTMKECKDTMKQILFMEICGVLAVRNNIIAKNLPGEPTPTDCGVGEWVAADCSVSCDDELQGGVHNLAREVITMNTKRGVDCPALHTQRKCKQIPCPVECGLSHWSTWGKCSKECGGGVQSQTRSLEVKPKNGGQACDALMQSQPCNTGSCDADCELGKWMAFKPCNKACSVGFEERRKRVLSKERGDGTCLPWNDKERLERRPCNTQACTGDEECNSTIDLVIAIDSSGSITEVGFDILKEFALRLVKRMMAPVQVGVVLFGNGKLDLETNIVSNAKVITDNLEGDMEEVSKKIEGMIIHKGFTNMAQAFIKSKDVLTYARKSAQSTVLIITDGRPSFKFQTGFAVKNLRKSARLMIVQVQANRKQEIAELLKGYASEPWSLNYRHISGKKKLQGAYDSYATSVLADLCPKLISPSAVTECTVLDGSGKSNVYPCECGKGLCKKDEICFADDHFCISEELMLLQGKPFGH
jgi:hypothetical protein